MLFRRSKPGERPAGVAFDETCGCASDAACAAEARRDDVRTWAITRGMGAPLGR